MFWAYLCSIAAWLLVILKALAVMGLAGIGGGALVQGLKGEKDGISAGIGIFLLVGALFLVRAWYWPH
jgi:hypothetical protein